MTNDNINLKSSTLLEELSHTKVSPCPQHHKHILYTYSTRRISIAVSVGLPPLRHGKTGRGDEAPKALQPSVEKWGWGISIVSSPSGDFDF